MIVEPISRPGDREITISDKHGDSRMSSVPDTRVDTADPTVLQQ